jgi:hypothetical protein
MDFIQKPLARFAQWATHPHKKYVYYFSEGSAEDQALLGNKGCHLCEMVRMKLPVPPGFVISTETCQEYFQSGHQLPSTLIEDYTHAVHELERQTGHIFGAGLLKKDPTSSPKGSPTRASVVTFPLLLSVRSGAAVSMVRLKRHLYASNGIATELPNSVRFRERTSHLFVTTT